jgi:hypothetical protein
MESIPISKTISIKEAGFNEYWLQNQIWENPNCLGIGDLESISKEKVTSSGGRLDILLKNPLDDSMYEVEVMLGETDASHIIRTIEYWDLIKRKWSQRQHFAVLVAERITKRFFNVIQLLSNSVPLIAIQVNIIDINGTRSLHFTKILDIYEEPEDDTSPTDATYNEEYWKKKSIHVLNIANKLFENTKDIYQNSTVLLRKSRITIGCDGYNQMLVHQRKGTKALLAFRFGDKKDEIQAVLDSTDISYTERPKQFTIMLNEKELDEHMELFRQIAELNNRWWE